MILLYSFFFFDAFISGCEPLSCFSTDFWNMCSMVGPSSTISLSSLLRSFPHLSHLVLSRINPASGLDHSSAYNQPVYTHIRLCFIQRAGLHLRNSIPAYIRLNRPHHRFYLQVPHIHPVPAQATSRIRATRVYNQIHSRPFTFNILLLKQSIWPSALQVIRGVVIWSKHDKKNTLPSFHPFSEHTEMGMSIWLRTLMVSVFQQPPFQMMRGPKCPSPPCRLGPMVQILSKARPNTRPKPRLLSNKRSHRPQVRLETPPRYRNLHYIKIPHRWITLTRHPLRNLPPKTQRSALAVAMVLQQMGTL